MVRFCPVDNDAPNITIHGGEGRIVMKLKEEEEDG
jgi:hypothetical protein